MFSFYLRVKSLNKQQSPILAFQDLLEKVALLQEPDQEKK